MNRLHPKPALFASRIVSGQIDLSLSAIPTAVAGWPDGPIVVRIEQVASRRSLKQLATWWGLWLDIVARETGSDPDELHEYCKQHFMPARHIQFVNAAGEFSEAEIRTTRNMNTAEMADWMEHGRAWMQSFFGVTLPEPDPNWRQHEDEVVT